MFLLLYIYSIIYYYAYIVLHETNFSLKLSYIMKSDIGYRTQDNNTETS
jgi:hypothetical protein